MSVTSSGCQEATTTPSRRRRRRWSAVNILRAVMVAAAAVLVLYGLYFFVGSDWIAEGERARIAEQWQSAQDPTAMTVGTRHVRDVPLVEGEGTLGLLHVPRWGAEYAVPIGPDDSQAVLDSGQVAHYTQTTPIGAEGNAALAGHRTSHGKPLREVHRLQEGDAVIVESPDAWLVYRVAAHAIVTPDRSEVLAPIPPYPGAVQGRHLTLTTCDPIYGITERYIVWSTFDYWTPKSEGLPPDLATP